MDVLVEPDQPSIGGESESSERYGQDDQTSDPQTAGERRRPRTVQRGTAARPGRTQSNSRFISYVGFPLIFVFKTVYDKRKR